MINKNIGDETVFYLSGIRIHCKIKAIKQIEDKFFYDVEVPYTENLSTKLEHLESKLFEDPKKYNNSEVY